MDRSVAPRYVFGAQTCSANSQRKHTFGATSYTIEAIKIVFCISLFLLLPVFLAFAVPTLDQIDFPQSFAIRSDFYKVDSVKDGEEPGFLEFQVTASHGSYEVEGLYPLKKLFHEIEVIERLKNDKAVGGFTNGVIDSVKSTGKGFVKLIAHPLRSTKDLGRAAKKLGGKIAGFFRKKEQGEKSGFGESLLGSSEREIAKKWGVDVYTDNPYLHELLERVAKAQMTGKGTVMVASFFLPIAGIASIVLTASGVNNSADQLVNDNDRWDVYQLNKKALVKLGFSKPNAKRFLNSPYYSPREATYVRFYLETLQKLEGYPVIFEHALDADSDLGARKILNVAQIAADTVQGNEDFNKLLYFEEGLALTGEKKVILITPYDHLDSGPVGDRVIGCAESLKRTHPGRTVEIWNAGKTTPAFYSYGLLKGYGMKDWVLFGEAAQKEQEI